MNPPLAAAAHPVICVAGPTGSGKSTAALALASRFNGVIINADSRQVYRDFPIITAQPTSDEQSQHPHTLYGFLETRDSISAGRWAAMATTAIEHAFAAGHVPILVGGTGLYMRTLFDGIADIPPVPQTVRDTLLATYHEEGLLALRLRLEQCDPVSAARIHPNDRQRTLRALEVYEATQRPLSWWHANTQSPKAPWPVIRLGVGLDLNALTPRLEARIHAMLDAGACEEAVSALKLCSDSSAPGWSGIGCSELFARIHGLIDDAELLRKWLANTRAYAKRQLTWFRADTAITWFTPSETEPLLKHVKKSFAEFANDSF